MKVIKIKYSSFELDPVLESNSNSIRATRWVLLTTRLSGWVLDFCFSFHLFVWRAADKGLPLTIPIQWRFHLLLRTQLKPMMPNPLANISPTIDGYETLVG